MKKILPAIFLPVAALATGCQQTTVHTHQTSAALAGASSVSPSSSHPSTTSAAAVSSSTHSSPPRNPSTRTTAVVVTPAPRTASTPAPAKKPEKREVYEEQTSEVVETYVFPASDEEMGR
jgi:hypothetical protein